MNRGALVWSLGFSLLFLAFVFNKEITSLIFRKSLGNFMGLPIGGLFILLMGFVVGVIIGLVIYWLMRRNQKHREKTIGGHI